MRVLRQAREVVVRVVRLNLLEEEKRVEHGRALRTPQG